jgi:TRAP-type transport system periplasmic protein
MKQPRKIRWLIAHQPQELFVRTARAFSQELAKYCGDDLEVEILTYPDYVAKYGEIDNLDKLAVYDETNAISPEEKTSLEKGMDAFWAALEDGTIEMSQTQVGQVARHHNDFTAIDLPYIFDDHEHVSRVVDGEIGQQLCRELGERSPVRGLAFTYSGGYRVVGSEEPIMSLDDMQGLRVVVENPLSLGNAVKKLGATTVQVTPSLWKKLDLIGKGEADAVETTYLRFAGKHVFKTNHSVFMTTILVSNKFWNTLTEDQQHAFTMAARAAAIIERQWALDDSARYEREAQDRGVQITDISEEDTARLKKASQHSYLQVNGWFSKGLLSRIRTA